MPGTNHDRLSLGHAAWAEAAHATNFADGGYSLRRMADDDTSRAERLRRLAAQLPVLESDEFTFGEWVPSWTDAEGVIHMPWYRLSPQAEAFLAEVGAAGWIAPFDWMTWIGSAEGKALSSSPAAVAIASADDLGRLLTMYVRSERFGDGSLEAAYASGMLTAIARRAGELAWEC
jgi:hypothetical protein